MPPAPPAVEPMYAQRAPIPPVQTGAEPRIFKMRKGSVETNMSVDATLRETMEQLLREFNAADVKDGNEASNPMELHAAFLRFVTDYETEDRNLALAPLLKIVYDQFCSKFLGGRGIHTATSNLDETTRTDLIQTCGNAYRALLRAGVVSVRDRPFHLTPASALFEAAKDGRASISAVFGGQGANHVLAELRQLYFTYPETQEYVQKMARIVHAQSKTPEALKIGLHTNGMNILEWLDDETKAPSEDYLLMAPVSFPLIGLVQLANYWLMLEVLRMQPSEVLSLFKNATGHSQGIVSAAVIASSLDANAFFENSERALKLLFWLGTRVQLAYPIITLSPAILADSLAHDEGVPTPMLAVAHLPAEVVAEKIKAANEYLTPDRQIAVTLVNGPRSVVVSGHPQSLYGLQVTLRELKAGKESQARIPFSKRKKQFSTKYLPVTAPFHSQFLANVPQMMEEDIVRENLQWSAALELPVASTFDGSDMRTSKDVTRELIQLITVKTVYWEKATAEKVTHMLDFGPGRMGGVGSILHRNKNGTGVRIVLMGVETSTDPDLKTKAMVFSADDDALSFAPDWGKEYAPQLVKVKHSGEVHLLTRMSRLLGKPPVMVAGMTPTTVNPQLVSAVMNAGYHCEVAGGGHFNDAMLENTYRTIMKNCKVGSGICTNVMFLNPFQWGFQYPLIMKLRSQGFPLEGMCVAAGVPSLDNANEIIEKSRAAGLRHIAFKPGSEEAIRTVLSIADANPEMPIMLQWTGGRAGGHHSFEDMHDPILKTYAAIRKRGNLVLVGGSGMGSAEAAMPYLTGQWSVQFQYPPMPFDGILLGSRMLVAKEALTSNPVKHLLAEGCTGVPSERQSEWEQTYDHPLGGIVTVTSELGEPIHKVATRGVMLWKELDEKIFALPLKEQAAAIQKNKAWIIERLNRDSMKLYFGKKADGSVADLDQMTYSEVVCRMVELMYVAKAQKWIDVTYRIAVFDMLTRAVERLAGNNKIGGIESHDALEKPEGGPMAFIKGVLAQLDGADTQLMSTEDVHFFLSICKRRWMKPVNFIPILDQDFKIYYKKDSLWQSENLDCVHEEDVQRVCILQGPVAVSYSNKANEPAKDILDGIYHGVIDALKQQVDENAIAEVACLGGIEDVQVPRTPAGVEVVNTATVSKFTLPAQASRLPDEKTWLGFLSGGGQTWLTALLMSPSVVRGKFWTTDNPVARLFRPRVSQTVRVERTADGEPAGVLVYDNVLSERMRENGLAVPAVSAVLMEGDEIEVTLNEPSLHQKGAYVALKLRYMYKPDLGFGALHEVLDGRNEAINNFYSQLWFGDVLPPKADGTDAAKVECTHTIRREEITAFCRSTNNNSEVSVDRGQSKLEAPLDFAIVVAWRAIMGALLRQRVDADLLRLVHLSNSYRVLDQTAPLTEGDVCETSAEVTKMQVMGAGMCVGVVGTVRRAGKAVLEVKSEFFYRDGGDNYSNTFENKAETPVELRLASLKDIAVLKSKEWISFNDQADKYLHVGTRLVFTLDTCRRYKNEKELEHVQHVGSVTVTLESQEVVELGTIKYERNNVKGDALMAYLARSGTPLAETKMFENGGYSVLPASDASSSTIFSPVSNKPYAAASGDTNPIHVNPYFSDFVDLPGTITHGMWTSASTRRLVEIFAADNKPSRITAFAAEFLGMVLPGDRLQSKLTHVGMADGKMIVNVDTFNQEGVKVLHGVAHIKQPSTAYVFTGQGSQEKGMGMDLYESSPVAKEIWDRADAHFLSHYGFSIVDIVRNNPKERTIYFGGVKGAAIRDFYRSVTYDLCDANGKVETLALFPDIKADSQFYTFRHPQGLLSATQFTQPALVLFEKAAFEDLRAKGLVAKGATFAGHSLGEYAALASFANVLQIESLMDVVFYRGMTMQYAVKRNADGTSDYGMMAANPSRVGGGFAEEHLQALVETVTRVCNNALLQIVNYNVEGWQYVLAGELIALEVATQVLNYVKKNNIKVASVSQADLDTFVAKCHEAVCAQRDANKGRVVLTRGFATIPLPGIDVPFHSRFLLSGVGPFRSYLKSRLDNKIDLSLLEHQYIPNLTAVPFVVSREYFDLIMAMTDSAELKQVATELGSLDNLSVKDRQRLGFALLVELLAFQFASPVQWIKTMDIILGDRNMARVVELGPSPTLVGMFQRTLQMKYAEHDKLTTMHRAVYNIAKDRQQIYFDFTTEEEVADEAPAASEPSAAAAPAPVVMAAPVAAAPVAGGPVTDRPVTTAEIVRAIVALKLKKKLSEVPMDKSIKDLVGGKSTLQNEILGDISAELAASSMPERVEELALADVADKLKGSGRLGKFFSARVGKLLSSKMPAGFNAKKAGDHLATVGLAGGSVDSVMLHALASEPAARIPDDAKAKAFLDECAQAYSSLSGVPLSAGGGAGAPMAAAPMMMAAPAAGGAAASVPDAPVTPLEFLRVLVALRLKKQVSEVPASATIKSVVGGKSTMQNELIGDIQAEFGDGFKSPNEAAEQPLESLAGAVTSYRHPGKVSRTQVGRMAASKLPGGFSLAAAKQYLESKYGLGAERQNGAFLHALTMEPATRLDSKQKAEAWLDSVATSYAQANSVSLGSGGSAGAGGMMMMGAGVDAGSSETYKSDLSRLHQLLHDNVKAINSYFGKDGLEAIKLAEDLMALNKVLEAEKQAWTSEHGEVYTEGIKPQFSAMKSRTYDSYWNWVRQEFLVCLYEAARLAAGTDPKQVAESEDGARLRESWANVVNKATPQLRQLAEYYFTRTANGAILATILKLDVSQAMDALAASDGARYRKTIVSHEPHCEITEKGKTVYSEQARAQPYLDEMASTGGDAPAAELLEAAQTLSAMMSVAASKAGDESTKKKLNDMLAKLGTVAGQYPMLHIREQNGGHWAFSGDFTQTYLEVLREIGTDGLALQNKTVLMTGCGAGSIGEAILNALLAAGAQVVVTSSSFSTKTTQFFRYKYEKYGGQGSALTLLPFNMGSLQDVRALVDYIYDQMGIDLDYVIPFAAISEGGREIDNIDDRSELAHRMMLTNVTRLMGAVKSKKQSRGYDTRPSMVILPLSPNHGVFGGDGLYAESKIALEVLFNKWHSESWAEYITLAGAVIGWTRGTGLMAQNNVLAEGVEKLGCRTFSTEEMAFNIVGLLHQSIADIAMTHPIWADFTGGMDKVEGLDRAMAEMRKNMNDEATTRAAVATEREADARTEHGEKTPGRPLERRANISFGFPEVLGAEALAKVAGHVKGMIDLSKVVVVTGYGEVGPWGNSRTRWEMERDGQFSLEGCVEMAWIMGFIKHFNGMMNGNWYSGWVDAATGQPIKDVDVKAVYEPKVLEHTGIRFIEPELFDGYDPNKKMFLRQVAIERDMAPVECTEEEAQHFKRQHGDNVVVYADDDGVWHAVFKKGAQLYIPKALKFDRLVAGQIPTGWDARRYGVPEDIVQQVDPVTLYNLVSTVEALVSSGITDPYEFYEYVHVSEVGNTSGGGVGGMKSNIELYQHRFMEKQVQGDILQETFINTMPAWVNLLLLSSSGPIKTPVGACATAVESVEIAVDTLLSGKAKVVIAGGYDDFQEPGSYEFAQMRATSDSVEEALKGRPPHEMSRPATTTRAGFMESQGAGNHVMMCADLAVRLGVPIYGIIALTNTATDKEGRSVPAPGQGILTTAREVRGAKPSQLLDISYRRRQLQFQQKQTKLWMEQEIEQLKHELSSNEIGEEEFAERAQLIRDEAERQKRAALSLFGNDFYKGNPAIAPLRGALAVFGLTADDIGVASFHGTSTKANDKNESDVLNAQLAHIGRTPGNPVPGIFQKYLTGHPKGAAAAWMLNGIIQAMNDGVVPGNRNADNIDAELQKFDNIIFPSKSLRTGMLKAGLLKSFGFGQVGGEALVVHPAYVLAALSDAELEEYLAKRSKREAQTYRYYHDAMTNTKAFVRIKHEPPYTEADEKAVYLNPIARATYDPVKETWMFKPGTAGQAQQPRSPAETQMAEALQQSMQASSASQDGGFGVDVELVANVNVDNPTFVERNFTTAEIEYCKSQPDAHASFAGRWAAKEAVIKAVSSYNLARDAGWKGAGAGLKEIEILPSASKAPSVTLHGEAKSLVQKAGIREIKVSISHSGDYAVATAHAC